MSKGTQSKAQWIFQRFLFFPDPIIGALDNVLARPSYLLLDGGTRWSIVSTNHTLIIVRLIFVGMGSCTLSRYPMNLISRASPEVLNSLVRNAFDSLHDNTEISGLHLHTQASDDPKSQNSRLDEIMLSGWTKLSKIATGSTDQVMISIQSQL